MKYKIIQNLFLSITFFILLTHQCDHEEMMQKFKPDVLFLEESNSYERNKMKKLRFPIRIHADFSSLEKNLDSNTKQTYQNILKIIKSSLFPLAINYLQNRIKVNPIKKLKLPSLSKNCHNIPIPDHHKTLGLDADLVLYVQAYYNPSYQKMSTSSICYTCFQDSFRPVAGMIQLNLYRMQYSLTKFEIMINSIFHEIIHIMGFSASMYGNFIDENGKLRGINNVIKQINLRGRKRIIIATPEVARVAREHYQCDQLEGIELEDNGESSKISVHWEKMVLKDEIMTASFTHNAVLSKFTLALLKDSGWYDVDYSKSMAYFYGKDQRCEFIANACNSRQKFREFCYGDEPKSFCDFGYDNLATCIQSSKTQTENCFLTQAYANGGCRNPENQNYNTLMRGEEYGPRSKCILNNIKKKGGQINFQISPGCYQASCEGGLINIFIQGQRFQCNKPGQKIQAHQNGPFEGFIICPEYKYFCANFFPDCPNYCSGRGNCHNGKCECHPSFTGDDCSKLSGCKNNCNDHGTCISDGSCRCNSGWTGHDCSIKKNYAQPSHGLMGKNMRYKKSFKSDKKCTNDCNGNGICENEECICNNGWTGQSCNEIKCLNNCNNNGKCENGQCKCNQGWSGDECLTSLENAIDTKEKIQIIKCNNNCNGNGKCINDQCECNEGWESDDCSQKIINIKCPNQCSGNGDCIGQTGQCICNVGFQGEACDQEQKNQDQKQEKKNK